MNATWPLLSVITFLPLTGVLFLMLVRGSEVNIAINAKLVALWVSGFTFFLSLFLYVGFDPAFVGYQFEEQVEWFAGAGISYHLGIDGISMPFILLSTFLVPLSILASWRSITQGSFERPHLLEIRIRTLIPSALWPTPSKLTRRSFFFHPPLPLGCLLDCEVHLRFKISK